MMYVVLDAKVLVSAILSPRGTPAYILNTRCVAQFPAADHTGAQRLPQDRLNKVGVNENTQLPEGQELRKPLLYPPGNSIHFPPAAL
jgi:hypothetical protein